MIECPVRSGEWGVARGIEDELAGFERHRCLEDRADNYSAIVAGASMAGSGDIDCGDAGPFNAEPPAQVADQIRCELEKLRCYH